MECRWEEIGSLISHSCSGGWGREEQGEGYDVQVAVLRSADFPAIAVGGRPPLSIRYEKASKVSRAALMPGDIVLEISGGTEGRPTGRTVLIEKDFLDSYSIPVIPASFCRLLRCEGINCAYLYYWLQDMYAKGRTWNYQNRSTGLSNFQFGLFRGEEQVRLVDSVSQGRIVSFLHCLDSKIKLNSRINDHLAEAAMIVFDNECPQTNKPNAVLSDIAEITMGQSPSGSSYNESGDGEVFYQGRAEFGSFFPRRRLFTTEPKRMAQEGDTLISVRAPVGDLNTATESCCIGRGLAAIHSESSQDFVHYLMRAQKKQLDTFNGDGTVFGSINGKALKELSVYLPNDDVVAHLQVALGSINAMIRRNDDEIRALEQLREALLPKLMSGEIDVSRIDLKQLNGHLSES